MIRFDHIEPPVIPDQNPNRPPPMPPTPAPDVVPVRDQVLPEHPNPVKEPPTHERPISTSTQREAGPWLRASASDPACRSSCA